MITLPKATLLENRVGKEKQAQFKLEYLQEMVDTVKKLEKEKEELQFTNSNYICELAKIKAVLMHQYRTNPDIKAKMEIEPFIRKETTVFSTLEDCTDTHAYN